jgi:hypothetical protein
MYTAFVKKLQRSSHIQKRRYGVRYRVKEEKERNEIRKKYLLLYEINTDVFKEGCITFVVRE